jgi:hypothetical protein
MVKVSEGFLRNGKNIGSIKVKFTAINYRT